MAHLMTILFFLAAGGIALGIIAGMVGEYADRIAAALGMRQPASTLPPLRAPRVRPQARPVMVRSAPLRAAA
ncbi:hypothetical protein SAMN06295912_107137 [Sphingomonas laterariae]|uniref:Uncharacterized protein n=1 Tax=Edaphosphingomonas laterariae TaxID=861865 RepID=A0A239EYB9_9SPHN|nr:hypothetical protein [Sphingomonas laterariae]SNS48824.1 hypothetical protein SAMN06295912_107137 [Sphingomonas laterariae]